MRTSRHRRPATARRTLPFASALVLFAASSASAADAISGTVSDRSGQPLPRAFVHVVDGRASETRQVFTDERGRFDLPGTPGDGCRVLASLTGFAAASAPCGADLRIVLDIAPIRETVVVTATRTEAPAQQVGASVTTFTTADLDARATPLVSDVLRGAPGTMLVRSGGVGSLTSLFVRGGESSYNKVLVDGIPINEPGCTFYFDNLTTENLDRIEIVRGPQSALFGSDAMASVVQLFTRRAGAGRPSAAFSLEGGSHGTVRASAAVSGRHGPIDYSVDAAHLTTNNEVPNSAFDNTTLSATAGRSFGESATLRFVGRGEFGRSGTPGQTAFGRADLDAFGTRHGGVAGVSFDQQLTRRVRQQASYSIAISDQQATNLTMDPAYTASYQGRVAPFETSDFLYDTRTNLRRHRVSYQADVRLANGSHGSHLLTVLSDWDGERATLSDRQSGTEIPASRNNIGASIQHQAVWRRVAVTGGGRVEHNDSFGTAFVPRVTASVVAANGAGDVGATVIHAAAGAGIKEPTLLQSFSPSPFFLGNPDLKPERSRSVEVGVDQRLASDRVRMAITWFDAHYENLIAIRTTNPETFEAQYFNVGVTRARGAELSIEAAPSSAVRMRAGYTFLDSEVVETTSPSSVVFQPGQPLFRRPRHSGFAELRWSRNRFAADVIGFFVGRFVDSDFSALQPPLLENPGYTTWDARGSYNFTARVSGLFAIDNLANAQYMEPLGYPALGRAVRIGTRVGF